MGVMSEECLELSAGSLDELLTLGTCLVERDAD